VFKMSHPNFYVNLTQNEYVRKWHKYYVKINIENVTLQQFSTNCENTFLSVKLTFIIYIYIYTFIIC